MAQLDTSLIFYPQQQALRERAASQRDRAMDIQESSVQARLAQEQQSLGKMAERATLKAALGAPLDERDVAAIDAYSALKGGQVYTDAFGNQVTKPSLRDNLMGMGKLTPRQPSTPGYNPQPSLGDLPDLGNVAPMSQGDMNAAIQNAPNMPAPQDPAQLPPVGTPIEKLNSIKVNSPLAATPYGQKALFDAELSSQKDAVKNANKPLNESQSNAATYADRMIEADAILSKLGNVQTDVEQAAKGALPLVGNFLTSSDFQKANQAQRNFVNAVLRKESGAAIPKEEFENARKQYFPQPGDSPEVIAQKEQNRKTAIDGISRAAGSNYKPKQPVAPTSTNAVDFSEYFK